MDGNDIVMTTVCGLALLVFIALVVWQSIIYHRLYVDNQEDVEHDGRTLRRASNSKDGSHAILLRNLEEASDSGENFEETPRDDETATVGRFGSSLVHVRQTLEGFHFKLVALEELPTCQFRTQVQCQQVVKLPK